MPAPGYHLEVRGKQQVAVHDITDTAATRQKDLDIGDAWDLLPNKQRRQTIDGKNDHLYFGEPIK